MNHEIKTGDIFELGAHRIGCGRAEDVEFVKKVVGGGAIRQILTDPPYGVAYVENKAHFKKTIGANLSNTTIIQGDQIRTDEEYAAFTKEWLLASTPLLADYNTAYIFNSDLMFCALRKGMKDAGFYYSQLIIWIKNNVVVGRKDFLPKHELIAYGWHGKHKTERAKQSSVMFYAKPHRSKLHPTMKPVGLLRQLILNSTKIGEIIYDPFLGSGSTMIAAENTRRRCIGIEISPEYVDISLKRWEKLTGLQARKVA